MAIGVSQQMLGKVGESFVLAIEAPLTEAHRCVHYIKYLFYLYASNMLCKMHKSYLLKLHLFVFSWDANVEKAWSALFRFIEFWMALPFIKKGDIDATLAGITVNSQCPAGAIDTELM